MSPTSVRWCCWQGAKLLAEGGFNLAACFRRLRFVHRAASNRPGSQKADEVLGAVVQSGGDRDRFDRDVVEGRLGQVLFGDVCVGVAEHVWTGGQVRVGGEVRGERPE